LETDSQTLKAKLEVNFSDWSSTIILQSNQQIKTQCYWL